MFISIANSIGSLRRGGGVDPDAAAFLAAAGITGATETAAVNTLVTDLKSDGLWSKMKALYPFVTDNRNLLGYTEDFGNAYWTKNNATVTTNTTTAPNGTTTADTITPTTSNSYHSAGTTSSVISGSVVVVNSVYVKSNGYNYVGLSDNTTGQAVFNLSDGSIVSSDSGITAFTPENVGNGWWRISIRFTATTSRGLGIDVWNNATKTPYAGNGTSGIFIWGAQLELGSTASTYQPIATTQQSYISSQFKYNLKDPRDLDAAFRLVFNGGWTHSSTGATPNGTNGYADTKFNTNTNQTVNNYCQSIYLRTSSMGSGFISDMGNYRSQFLPITNIESNATIRYQYCWDFTAGNGSASITTTDSSGLWGISRTATNSWVSFERNTAVSKTTTTTQSTIPNNNVYLGATNGNGTASAFSFRQIAFSHLSDGLSSSEFNNFYTAVQAFQTTLNRAIAP